HQQKHDAEHADNGNAHGAPRRRNAITSAAMVEPTMPSRTAVQCQKRGKPRSAGGALEPMPLWGGVKTGPALTAGTAAGSAPAARLSGGTQRGAMSSIELTTMFSSRRNTQGSARKNVQASSSSMSS